MVEKQQSGAHADHGGDQGHAQNAGAVWRQPQKPDHQEPEGRQA